MTELQVTICNLKDALIAGELFLMKMEKAKKDLEKTPPHKWEHGDVFMNDLKCPMILMSCRGEKDKVFCLGPCTGHRNASEWLARGKFLFNVKEKL